jgi:hypothetical protein
MVKYRLYPTLLDEFQRYREEKVSIDELLNRINRVRDFDDVQWARMQRGTRFEKAVVSGHAGEFSAAAVEEVRTYLPARFKTQYPVKCVLENSLIYGYADVVGEKRVIDLKTTRTFFAEKYLNSYQNLYLYALEALGCTRMEYVVYDFQRVHHLVLNREDVDLDRYSAGIRLFEAFLEEHRASIVDERIFVKTDTKSPNLFD